MRTMCCAVCGRLIDKDEPRFVERVRPSFMEPLLRLAGVRRQAEDIHRHQTCNPAPEHVMQRRRSG